MTHVIYIHTHDSGRLTGAYGVGNEYSSIKNFAKDALLFRQAFCTNPTCSPSRSSLLTGLYPHENGMLGLANRGFSIDDYNKHLVSILKNEGYHTALCGIQHEAGRYTEHAEGSRTIGYDEDLSVDFDMSDEGQLHIWDQLNANALNRWLEDYDQSKPLFLSYGLFSTHRPFPILDVPTYDSNYVSVPGNIYGNVETRKDYAKYLDSLSIADNCFGSVIETLKRTGIYEDAIILFTTDHGIAMPFSKCNLFDAGIGVSFIMRTPNMKRTGLVTDSLISQVDYVPTVLELLDIKTEHKLSGKSFARLFEDENAVIREDIFTTVNFHTSYEPMRAVRTERYKYIKYFDDYLGRNLSNIDEGETKDFYLSIGFGKTMKNRDYLFDLYYDPSEKNNLVDNPEYEVIYKELQETLYQYMIDTSDPLLEGNITVKDSWKVNKVSSLTSSPKDPNEYV